MLLHDQKARDSDAPGYVNRLMQARSDFCLGSQPACLMITKRSPFIYPDLDSFPQRL